MALFNSSYTNISSQFGMPLFGVAGVPPFTGNYFWVDETRGSDGNTGGPQDPLATLSQAHSKCLAGNNDVVFLTGTVHTTATLAWSKNNTHLIGLSAPSDNDRSRISQTGSTVFSPLVNVTASGCIFKNIGTFHGFNDASTQICWAEAGGRNYYENVQFLGMGHATAAAQAGSRSLTVGGSGENLFVGCTIGLDTVVRATNANASLEFITATTRNILRNCIFQADVSDAADTHVTIGLGGIDRYVLFDNCTFLNAEFGGPGATAMTAAFSVHASAGGQVLVQGGGSVGAGKISAAGPVYVSAPAASGTAGVLAVVAS
jgi:hypothetical protein